MKIRLIALLAAALMLIGLTACNSAGSTANITPINDTPASTPAGLDLSIWNPTGHYAEAETGYQLDISVEDDHLVVAFAADEAQSYVGAVIKDGIVLSGDLTNENGGSLTIEVRPSEDESHVKFIVKAASEGTPVKADDSFIFAK
ncbi:MAG: hypothetical protein IJU16_00385 [Clostridia bacterium]|nr:hypothetical protein [Clostridia bacterium]